VGKRADLVVLRSPRLLDLVRVGVPAIQAVVKDGKVVVREGRRVPEGGRVPEARATIAGSSHERPRRP
jgi:hypothetical protein